MKRSKRILSLLLSIVMILGMLPMSALAANGAFSDVKTSDWFYDDVRYVCEKGLLDGTGSNTFNPKATTTRGMIVTILYRLSGEPAGSGVCPFSDVAAGKYYEKAIAWAAENRIVSGYADGTFGPDNAITREQFAAILYRYAVFCGYAVTASAEIGRFADADMVGSYALTAMKWASAEGLINGSGSKLDPKGSATRAQAAAILARFCKNIADTSSSASKAAIGSGTVLPPAPRPDPDPIPDPNPTYTVTFDSNGGSAVASQTVAAGQTATEPEAPTRSGYRFVAWYSNSTLTELYSFETPVTANITLYAKWDEIASGEGGFLDEPEAEVEFYSFTTDTWDILAGSTENVTFTAEIFSEIDLSTNSIRVADTDGNTIGYMHDDGANGDVTANDGIYTLCVLLGENVPTAKKYAAHFNDIVSADVTISFYKLFTEAEIQEMKSCMNAINEKMIPYLDETGYVIEEKLEEAVQAITKYLDELKSENVVSNYSLENGQYSIMVYLTSGMKFVHQFALEGKDFATIRSNQPYKNTYSAYRQRLSDEAADGSARLIASTFPNLSFNSETAANELNTADDDNYDLEEVSLEALKTIGKNKVVTWHGHGGYSRDTGSFMGIGMSKEDLDWDDKAVVADYNAGRIVTLTDGGIAVSGGFFEKYLQNGSLQGSILYLGTCSSAKDMLKGVDSGGYQLAQELIDKGATAVVANSETICTRYNASMERDVFKYMCQKDSAGNYYTLAEALERAFDDNGRYCCEEDKAYPIIFPRNRMTSNNYRLSDLDALNSGTIAGVIKSAADRSAVANALIRVYTPEGKYVTSTRTDADGKYTIGVAAGEYVLKVSASSYKSVKMAASVQEGHTTYTETFLLLYVGISTGFANGTITNSITGVAVDGVTVNVRLNWNNRDGRILYTTQTNSAGYYQIDYIMGLYTIEYYKSGYITGYKNIVVSPIDFEAQDAVISPVTSDSAYRIVLTWGENPRDLDSHMVGTLSSGESFHVYFGHKSQMDGDTEVCNLDIDDVTSYGPETITLNATTNQPYYYYVYRYAGSGTVATSGAQVKVYRGSELVYTFYVPTDLGNGDYWNVFAIVDGELQVRNTITSSAETSYAGTVAGVQSLGLDIMEAKTPS